MGDPNLMRDDQSDDDYVIRIRRRFVDTVAGWSIIAAVVLSIAVPAYGWRRASSMLAETERLLEQSEHRRQFAEQAARRTRESGRVQSVLRERDAIYAIDVSHER